MKYLLLAFFLALPSFSASVEKVVDGDTLKIKTVENIRIAGIDTPERGQENYKEAKNKMIELFNHSINIHSMWCLHKRDFYGRQICQVIIKNKKGKKIDIGLEMIKAGLAKPRYTNELNEYTLKKYEDAYDSTR